MSLYSDYVNEVKGGREIIEIDDKAFISFFVHKNLGECYIEDFYIIPSLRGTDLINQLLGRVETTAREFNCNVLTFSVLKTHEFLVKMLERASRYGFKNIGENENEIYFLKELRNG
jgi:GNAT superfamily N-acetyltransferase